VDVPPPPNPGADANRLISVDVLTSCSAWAVGSSSDAGVYKRLVEHWNGTSWKVQASPRP
jgi:hypothetical protein